MSKKIIFHSEAREALKRGVDILSDAVKATLGPRGRNVVIEKEHENPISTKDGVTVANEISLSDPYENLGAQMVREVADQTNDEAGDGTTTATVLARAIIEQGHKLILAGSNPIELKRGIDKAVKEIKKSINEISKEIKNSKEIAQVAKISANNDEEIGNLISEAMEKVGIEGVISIEEGKTSETVLEVVEGIQFDSGYLSPYFINNNEKMQVQFENPSILICDSRLTSLKPLVKILEYIISKNKPLLIISEDIEGEALAGLIVNKARGTCRVAAVKAPDFGKRRDAILEDIASITGATVVSDKKGMALDKVQSDVFGTAKSITITNKNTIIIDGGGEVSRIEERLSEIKAEIDTADSDYDIEKLQERLGKLTGGVAVVEMGAESELEMKERKYRAEDALHATRAAIDQGIVPGGGLALLLAIQACREDLLKSEYPNPDQLEGVKLALSSCEAPFRSILENAGLNADVIKQKILDKKNKNWGFDARNEEYVDMIKAGIIDPAKVTKTALDKAASVAGTMLTTECVIAIDPDKEENNNLPMM
jgi:chaperonin GroEL